MKVAIIGAGLIGRLAALKLIGSHHDVTLLEANSFDSPHNAAAISAGLISPISESIYTTPNVIQMGFQSLSLWPEILSSLRELDPHHDVVNFSTNGTIAISFPEEQECLLVHQQKLQSALPSNKSDIKLLYNDEVAEMEPELGMYETALYLKGEGNLCNSQFMAASARVLRKYASIVDHWPLKGDGKELQNQYDWVIDCRGAGAVNSAVFKENIHRPLIAVRGEAIRVHTEEVNLLRPIRVIQQRFNIYIVPKPNNIFVVGATVLDKRGNHAVTVRSSLDLLSALYALHPGFADAEIIEAVAGQRAMHDDREPSIITDENIIRINGLGRQGWLVAPVLVSKMMNKIFSSQAA
jgi:glycine oxidase